MRLGLTIKPWGSVKRSKRYRVWHRVIREWAEIHRRYWRATRDLGWWSGERANVSLLGNAVWRAGGYSLQEYGDIKKSGKREYRGRPDMYALLQGHHFVLEAKQCWSYLVGDWRTRITTRFDSELAGIARRNNADDYCLAAVCFASHRIPVRRGDDASWLVSEYQRADYADPVREHFPAGYRADLFPLGNWRGLKLKHVGWPVEKPTRYYVGVTMLIGFCSG